MDENQMDNFFLADEVIGENILSCDSDGTFGSHWKIMMEKPEDRIYTWHDFTSDSKLPIKSFWRQTVQTQLNGDYYFLIIKVSEAIQNSLSKVVE